jgi:hypothetical protein
LFPFDEARAVPAPLIWLLTLSAQAPVGAVAVPRPQTPGLAVALEAGRYAAGYGVAAVYYQPVAAGRATLWAKLGAGVPGEPPRTILPDANLGVAVGYRHRALLAVGWTAIGRSVLSLHGTVVDERWLHGPDAGAGYEYLSDAGLMFRVVLGGVYLRRAWHESTQRLHPAFSLAFGRKLW